MITRISLDHTELLGGTVAEIAKHKAGILPTGGHGVVQRHHQASVRAAIADVARVRHCELDIVDPHEVSSTVTTAGTKLHHSGADLALGLQGRHQGINATLAMHAASYLATRDKWLLDPLAVRAGLASARLPGRCERHILDGRNVLLDGAHNALKLIALADFIRALHPGPRATWVIALKTGKDLAAALAAIAPTAAQVIATQFEIAGDSSSIPAAVVADRARALGLPAVAVDDPVAALETALSYDYDPIVVAGSFHLVAAVSSALRLAERVPFAEALTMPMTHPVSTLEPIQETAS